jgi:hypothetical protein
MNHWSCQYGNCVCVCMYVCRYFINTILIWNFVYNLKQTWYSMLHQTNLINLATARTVCLGSVFSIVYNYTLDNWDSIPNRAKDLSSSLCVQTSTRVHPASCPVGSGGPFPVGKAQLWHDSEHSPPSSAEIKNELQLHLPSPPAWHVSRTALLILDLNSNHLGNIADVMPFK